MPDAFKRAAAIEGGAEESAERQVARNEDSLPNIVNAKLLCLGVIPMTEPTSTAAMVKALIDALNAVWERSALLLWCITTAGTVVLLTLLAAAYWQVGDAVQLLTTYGLWLFLAILLFAVFAIFKSYSEITNRPLSFIPSEEGNESYWSQTKQPSGQTFTTLHLRFQVTNVSNRQ